MAKPALLILSLSLVLLTAAAPRPRAGEATVVLSYADFGPQVMAHELLGMELYQWETEQGPSPHRTFDIKVVVHQGLAAKALATRFPVVRGKSDYRYLLKARALGYLDERLLELKGAPRDESGLGDALIARLLKTRERIVAALGK